MSNTPYASSINASPKYTKYLFVILSGSFIFKIIAHFLFFKDDIFWASGYSLFYEIASNFLTSGEFFIEGPHMLYDSARIYALRPPLYPFFLACAYKLFHGSEIAILTLQAVLSTLTVFLAYRITLLAGFHRAGLFVAMLLAFYPYSFVHDLQMHAACLYNFFSIVSYWLILIAIHKDKHGCFLLAGLAIGLAALTRSTHVVHAFFILIWLVLLYHKNLKTTLIRCSLLAFGILLCIAPWLLRNKQVIGQYTMTSFGGLALAEAHNPFTFSKYPYRGAIDAGTWEFKATQEQEKKLYFENTPLNETEEEKYYKKYALEYIKEHPLQVLARGFVKVGVNFFGILSPLGHPLKTGVYFLSYWLLTFLACWGVRDVWKTPLWGLCVTLIISQSFLSFIMWAHTSHRSFLDPLLAILAGIGLSRLKEKWAHTSP